MTTLDLSKRSLDCIPDGKDMKDNVTTLILSKNSITKLVFVTPPRGLQKVILRENELKVLEGRSLKDAVEGIITL